MSPPPPAPVPLRFGCTGCGRCCAKPGVVYLSGEEVLRMARYLRLEVADFRWRYDVGWIPEEGVHTLEAREGRPCLLLDEEGRCRVHAVKPDQCRTFPFWDELLDSASAWRQAGLDCEGIDHPEGRLYSLSEIRVLRRGDGRTD